MEHAEYTRRLIEKQGAWWKKVIDVQAPYRMNLRSLRPGFTLDIGCGIGRNLQHLRGDGVGVDTNPHSIEYARSRGFKAYVPSEFHQSPYAVPNRFDSILLSHVLEHMTLDGAKACVSEYLPYLKPEGRLIFITPQEVGQKSDPTHVEFMDFEKLRALCDRLGFKVLRSYSFPFPRSFGKVFIYNEFVVVASR